MHLAIDVSTDNVALIARPNRDGHPGPTSILLSMDTTHFFDQREEELAITIDTDITGKATGMKILQKGIARYARKIK